MSKKAIITGGARRLGKAMALELASKGTDIIIHYNKANEDAEETRDLARSKGVKAEILQADLLEMTDTIELVAKAKKTMGGAFDLLINNASIFEYDNLNTVDIESWDRHINSNLRSAVFLTQKFAQQAPTTENNTRIYVLHNCKNGVVGIYSIFSTVSSSTYQSKCNWTWSYFARQPSEQRKF